MAKRELQEINAGSMADIAFLLLIFFLVTTTIDNEEGVVTMLPQKYMDENYKPEPVEVRARDLYNVLANFKDELLIEEKPAELSDVRQLIKDFYTDPFILKDDERYPLRRKVTAEICTENVANYQNKIDENPEDLFAKVKLNEWTDKLEALKILGDFYEMPPASIIFFKSDNGTSYGFYIGVINEIKAAVNELRSQYCLSKFGVTFESLNDQDVNDLLKIKAVKFLYPDKMVEVTK
jgi:biopolymer transport protein ExbD